MAILVPEPELGFERRATVCHAVGRLDGEPPILGVHEPPHALTCGSISSSSYPSICFQREEYTTSPVSRFMSHTPSRAPATASASRSSLLRRFSSRVAGR